MIGDDPTFCFEQGLVVNIDKFSVGAQRLLSSKPLERQRVAAAVNSLKVDNEWGIDILPTAQVDNDPLLDDGPFEKLANHPLDGFHPKPITPIDSW